MSCARMTLLKEKTLPQLKVTALEMALKHCLFIRDTFLTKFKSLTVWTNLEMALEWLLNNTSALSYMRNRTEVIRKLAHSVELKYVPVKDNPADHLTKPISLSKLRENMLWCHGPSGLSDSSP